MSGTNRRDFLKASALIGTGISVIPSTTSLSAPENILSPDRMGTLVDTTVCIGCRKCEWACKISHNIPSEEKESYEDRSIFKKKRRPELNSLTVVNEFTNKEASNRPIDVKIQCMHCDQPACVSACIVGAFSKKENGSVVWNSDMCIGCRYCMVACPFQIPVFEYNKAIDPKIMKCDFCYNKTKNGELPACVNICPVEALTYGPRSELIKIARNRIKRNPDRYVDHIFGELEVGGTSWMYLSSKKFSELAFPQFSKEPAPGVSESIQHGIFAYFVPPISLYALLGGMMWLSKRRKDLEKEEKI